MEWKWIPTSEVHQSKFAKLLEYGKKHPEKIREINRVRVCCSTEFLLGRGCNGTRVYIGLARDGREKAITHVLKGFCDTIANGKSSLNTVNAVTSQDVVKYWFYDDETDDEYAFLISDLCEETLENYVEDQSQESLTVEAPTIIRQILKGLRDLQRQPTPILHRNLKPSNILRDVRGKWLLADFGIGRVLTKGQTTYHGVQAGTNHWRAVETYPPEEVSDVSEVRYKKESGIQAAGMIIFYILTKGKDPFGFESDRERNLRDGKPVGLVNIADPLANDLISWMLKHQPKERPSVDEALQHPYLQPPDQQFELLSSVGNQLEVKNGDTSSQVVQELNKDPCLSSICWKTQINHGVYGYLCALTACRILRYEDDWTGCFQLIQNTTQLWDDQPRPHRQAHAIMGNPQAYFLNVFPFLPAVVHRVIRSSDWKDRPGLRKFFISGSEFDSSLPSESNQERKVQETKINRSVRRRVRSTDESETKDVAHFMETISSLEMEVKNCREKLDEAGKKEANYNRILLCAKKMNEDLKIKVKNLEEKCKSIEEDFEKTKADLGSVLVEKDAIIREMKSREVVKPTPVNTMLTADGADVLPSSPQASSTTEGNSPVIASSGETHASSISTESSQLPDGCQSSNNLRDTQGAEALVGPEKPPKVGSEIVSQASQASQDKVSLGNMPTSAVERSLYNNYKLLLLLIVRALLADDVAKFKDWVNHTFSINPSLDVSKIFLELDCRGVISALDLGKLRDFFASIVRIDVVHMIDCFMAGNYTPLFRASHARVMRANNQSGARGSFYVVGSDSSQNVTFTSLNRKVQASVPNQAQGEEAKQTCLVPQSNAQGSSRKVESLPCHFKTEETNPDNQAVQENLVTNSPVGNNATSSNDASANATAFSRERRPFDMGSNGRKLSKFARPDSPRGQGPSVQTSDKVPRVFEDDLDDESQWLCSHYKRRCYVKFGCCDKYWPCHRCHNNDSTCVQKKLKSRDTKMVKCAKCGTEQEFTSESQFCRNCHIKFAKYFCAICKHLTGTDDHPYHCSKCGICRIHSDHSFHCDVCGVCLDVQLRGKHKCRAGSAHDECCICLEDAFTGCQILPCSHKVHKECATQMIRSGITRCPVCRESFAHKLERRRPPPAKVTGKH